MCRRAIVPLWLGMATWLANVDAARAQVPVATPIRPAASTESHITTESSRVLPAWTPSAALFTVHEQWLAPPAAADDLPTVSFRTTSHLVAGLGILDWAQFDVALPLVVYQNGDVPTDSFATGADEQATLEPSALGDVRTGLKGTVLRTPSRGFGAGVGLDITWPTGSSAAVATEGARTYTPWIYGENRTVRGIESAINLGYTVRPDTVVGSYATSDAFAYRLATRVPFGPQLGLAGIAELDGSIGIADAASSPLVARGGFRWRMRSGVVLGLYAGGALVSGYNVAPVHGSLTVGYVPPHRVGKERAFAGSPRPSTTSLARRYERAAALARKTPEPAPVDPRDPDGDGVLAVADACPSVAEDIDKFEDADGCPEWDNDRDGLRDALDLCPVEPEVINGFADWDGCPDIRLADGSGRSSSRFDARQIYPKVIFAPDSAELVPDSQAALVSFAELVRLNPWMGQVDLRIEVHAAPDQGQVLALADQRAETVTAFLHQLGVDDWRVQVGQPALVPAEREEHLRIAIAPSPSGLRPLAPPAPVFERLMATAADEARADEAAKQAALRDVTPHGARIDPAGRGIMAQGPDEGSNVPAPATAVTPATAPAASPDAGTKPTAPGSSSDATPDPDASVPSTPAGQRPAAKDDGESKTDEAPRRKKTPSKKKASKAKKPAPKDEGDTPISGKLLDMLNRDGESSPPE